MIKQIMVTLLFSGVANANVPSFIEEGQFFYEDLGTSFDDYNGTKVKLTVIKVEKKSDWVLFKRSFGRNNKEKVWMNTHQINQLVLPAKSSNH